MGRGTFRSQNKVGETMSFQTDSSSATTFDPTVTFLPGLSDRVSWDLGDGSGYVADSSLSYSYDDTGTTKTVTLRTNKLSNLYGVAFNFDNLVGDLDFSGWDNMGGSFNATSNPKLTGITHTTSTEGFYYYNAQSCNLIGNHDMSMFPNLGGTFLLGSNSELTGVTHTTSTQVFSSYQIQTCNLIGNHDVSMFPNLGGDFRLQNNSELTGVTHTASTQLFTVYYANSCNLIGNHDVSMFPNLGGNFRIYSNSALTGITHTASTQTFSDYWVFNCNLIGNHDVSMFPNLGGIFFIYSNPLLTSVTHTASTQVFTYYYANSCNLGYVDFKPLSGTTFNSGSGIRLYDNNMSVTDVNHILVDLSVITVGNSGWTGSTIDISGTNAAPDSSSGGFDGIAAISTLTGVTNNWTVITS